MNFRPPSFSVHNYPFFDLPQDAQESLLNLYSNIAVSHQAAGSSLYGNRQLSVRSWDSHKHIFAYRVGRYVETKLIWDVKNQSWRQICECEMHAHCSHVAAVIHAMIGKANISDLLDEANGKKPDDRLAHAEKTLGRSLVHKERQYLKNVVAHWRQYAACGHLPTNTLFNLDYASSQYALGLLKPPAEADFPLFWSVLAFQARKIPKLEIPEFMRVFENDELAQAKCLEYKRARQVDQWKRCISDSLLLDGSTGAPAERYDLRVVVNKDDFTFDARPEKSAEFKPLSATAAKHLYQSLRDGQAQVLPEAAAVFFFLKEYRSLDFGGGYNRRGDDEILCQAFFHLALTTEGRQRIVSPAGLPYDWPGQPLRWTLVAPESADDDAEYVMSLPDGKPVGSIVRVIRGSTPLYVTPAAIYRGPRCLPDSRQSGRSPSAVECVRARIPVEALLSREGIDFLAAHQLPPPKKIAKRIKPSPLRLHVVVKLHSTIHLNECFFTFRAEHANGSLCAEWKPDAWIPAFDKKHAEFPASGPILSPDYSGLPNMLEIVRGALKMKFDPDRRDSCWTIKVGKSFHSNFAQWLDHLPPGVDLSLPDDLAPFREPPISASFQLECAPVGDLDWFDLKVVVHAKDVELTPEELQALVAARGKFVELPGKGWRRLAYDVSPDDNAKLARLGLQADDLSGEPQRLHALQLADPAAEALLAHDQYAEIRRRAAHLKAQVAPPVPAAIRADLRQYQIEGFHFLAYLAENSFGGILADDMGLGKTLQALAWLAWLREKRPAQPALVVCPKSVADNWHHEAAQFYPSLKTTVWRGSGDADFAEAARSFDLVVVNYSQLRALSDAAQSIDWLAAILDEGQYVKNPQSQTAVAARKLPAAHRLVLTGTPIENRLLDLWSLMSYCMPGLLGPQTRFSRQYDRAGDPLARQRLSARVRPFLLRRTKNQVAPELPPRTEEDLVCDMTARQETLYRAELKAAQMRLLNVETKKDFDNERFNFLTSLLRLRQICCHPGLFAGDDPAAAQEPGAKEEALLDLLEPLMEEGHKVLVFSQFVTVIERLAALMAERNWNHFVLTGETENRGTLVHEFQTSDDAAVFLISLKAGGFGLNLTAASYVVLFDPWWNPAVENQAIDRTHRIGQTRPVIAYRLIARNSIEEKIRRLQQSKSALASAILGEEQFAKALSLDDLRYLLADDPGEPNLNPPNPRPAKRSRK